MTAEVIYDVNNGSFKLATNYEIRDKSTLFSLNNITDNMSKNALFCSQNVQSHSLTKSIICQLFI